jgi:hypothetical protein
VKVLVIIPCFYPSQVGGPCSAISWLTKHLTLKNIEVTIVTTNLGIANGIVKTNVWQKSNLGNVIYNSYWILYLPFRMMITAVRLVPKSDIVHLNSIFYPPSIVVATAAILCRKVVFWDPGGELAEKALKYGRFKKKIYLTTYYWTFLKNA